MDIRIKPLEWEERKTRLGTVWWSAPNPLGGLSIEAASESDKIAAQADYERRIRSALEPAAPEGAKEELQLRVRLAVVAKYAEIDCPPLALHILNQFADAALAQEAVMTNPQELLTLLKGEFSSLTIGFNDDHACNYATAQSWHDEWGQYGGDADDDRIKWVSEEERLKAIRENSVWTIQWYPDTPVGFYCVGASTFEAAARFALGRALDEQGR